MTGSSLPCAGELGQVAAIAFQGLVGRFGIRRRDPLVAAHLLQRGHQPVAGDAELLEEPAGGAAVVDHGQQQMLDGDVLVLEALGLVLGLAEQPVEPAADVPTAGGRFGETIELLLDPASQPADVDIRLAENGNRQALVVVQEGKQQVLDVDLRVSRAAGVRLGCRQRLLGLFREPIDVHSLLPSWLGSGVSWPLFLFYFHCSNGFTTESPRPQRKGTAQLFSVGSVTLW